MEVKIDGGGPENADNANHDEKDLLHIIHPVYQAP